MSLRRLALKTRWRRRPSRRGMKARLPTNGRIGDLEDQGAERFLVVEALRSTVLLSPSTPWMAGTSSVAA